MKNLCIVFLFLHTDGLLYPYGPSTDKVTPKLDDGVSPPIPSTIPLFGKNVSSIYVNNNGILSFDATLESIAPLHLPIATPGPCLAPFWADVNSEISGNVYYRLSNDLVLLNMTRNDISSYFPAVPFSPKWVFVATWEKVSYFDSKTNKVNTFQAVLSTDGNATFIVFNYGDIQWPTGKENEGPPALAGCNSGFSQGYFEIPGSLTADMINITQNSNVNFPGRWVFRVDQAEVGTPTMNKDSTTSPTPTKAFFTSTDNTKVTSPSLGSSTSTATITPDLTPSPAKTHFSSRKAIDPPFTIHNTIETKVVLYPFGDETDNVNPKSPNGESPPINAPFPWFKETNSAIYVQNIGRLTVEEPGKCSTPQLRTVTREPFFAPFWADINNEISGDIYYRLSNDSEILNMTGKEISSYFPEVPFSPNWVLVATWDKVSYFGSKTNKVNTFQAVLSTDGNSTFIMFNYGDIQWPTGKENEGPLAFAGYNTGFAGGSFEIPGSADKTNITHTSNVNVPGRWVFRVDHVKVEPPTISSGQQEFNPVVVYAPILGCFLLVMVIILLLFKRPSVVTSSRNVSSPSIKFNVVRYGCWKSTKINSQHDAEINL